ncbi:3'-5' exonuclease [Psychrobacter sp. FDAARGOS_221]|uniref:3'-5' exonuclease n=1 Tax=Psychrobacter sp. FDAARGOS_221 TaxID=1975705 RepID=UPI000BB59290|nr:3'-5' exonuclease [Psychrobacter sp. FDAARGOS_221]PNK60779.1 hypothetical protein A6J60_007735 [Psychrobacter sp. FDAARGOS_221]
MGDVAIFTIHKSKGAEFANVVLVLEKEEELDFITNPDLHLDEKHRLRYVAISRAINNLFITVPTLDNGTAQILESLDIVDIIRV